jgi:hypothetical protein
MDLVHRMQDGREDDAGDPVELRRLGKEEVDAALFAFMAQAVRDPLIAGDARGIEREDRAPGPRRRLELAEELLPAWPVLVAPLTTTSENSADDSRPFAAASSSSSRRCASIETSWRSLELRR